VPLVLVVNKLLWISLALILLMGLAVWFWPENKPVIEIVNQPEKPSSKELDKPVQKALNKDIDPDEAFLQEDPYQNAAIQAQLLQVADLYAEAAKYPHTSQPIRNPDTVREPEPFTETEVDTPFPIDDLDEPIRLLAAVDRYQYFSGDLISARLQVAGAPPDTFVSAKATISGEQGDTPLSVSLNPSDETLKSFTGSFDTRAVPAGLLSTEMLLKLQVEVGKETLFTTVPFRYTEASAQLAGVQYVRPEAENLVIALQYSVFQSGYYFVAGVLEDARTGQPLLRLQGENRLNQGNGTLVLRAHIGALRTMGSEGPYVLRSIKTYRGSETGEAFDVPASSVQSRYSVPGFAFDQYEDIPHHDEGAQDRIDFLENLGGGNDSPEARPQDQELE